MLITDNKKQFYDVITQSKSHVLVFVSHDLDSIASVKIIRHIFECEHVRHTIVPIRTRNELQRSYQEHRDGVKVVLLINIGAMFDILEFFMPDSDVKIFVADCHRPFNVNNVYYDTNVFLMSTINSLNSVEKEFETIPKYEEVFWDSEVEDDDDVRNLTLEQLKKRNAFKQFEKKRAVIMNAYEEFCYYSYSTALIFFDLAWKLGRDSNELLWLSILSVVDKENDFKLPDSLMKKEVSYLHDSMLRLRNIRSDRGFVLNPVAGLNEDSQHELVTTTNHLNISYEKDLNLRLYREWSLYDSLQHTMYVACKFKIWKFRGNRRLHTFLADLGLPINECKQKYSSMDLNLRNTLRQSIEEKTDRYGISGIITDSFVGNRGLKQKFSTKDLAEASRALLESPDKDKRYNQKFFDSYDSMSWSNMTLIDNGITLAKAQLISVAKQVQLIMDAHLVSHMNNVLLYVVIPEGAPDASLFCHPGCLRALSIYSLYAYASLNNKSKKTLRLPLVVISPDPERTNMGIVCGISPLLALRECKTFFKQAFSAVSSRLSRVDANFVWEECLVDPDIGYIPYSDRMAFLTELSLLLESN